MTNRFSSARVPAIALLVAVATFLASPHPASAQYAHFFRDAALTPADIELAQSTAATLYTKEGVKAGEKANWQNPQTGAEGYIEMLEVEDGGSCVVFRHMAKAKARDHVRYYVRKCLDDDGKWMLAPN